MTAPQSISRREHIYCRPRTQKARLDQVTVHFGYVPECLWWDLSSGLITTSMVYPIRRILMMPEDFAVAGTETKIDGAFLTLPEKVRRNCASTSTKFIEPMIAINRDVSISSLNLYGENNIAIGEPENPIDSVESYSVTIKNTVLDSFLIPMTFANAGCERSHARSTLIFSNNVLRNGGFFGLALFNFITGTDADDTSNGPQINATISFNLFYNNPGTAFTARGGAI